MHGIIAFDAFNRLIIRVQHLNPAVRGCGARTSWGIDDPAELERASPTAVLPRGGHGPLYSRGRRPAAQHPAYRQAVPPFPPLRDMCLYLRYEF